MLDEGSGSLALASCEFMGLDSKATLLVVPNIAVVELIPKTLF